MEPKKTPKPKLASTEEVEEACSVQEEQKTPLRPGRGVKRKNTSPIASTPTTSSTTTSSPSPAVFVTPSKDKDDGKPSSAKKRRKSTSSSLALGKVGSPSTSFNPAAMTERQQMAYLLQMTDPQKKPEESPTPVKDVLITPSRVQKRNERGETPLHIACIRGDLHMATSLIEQGAEVNVTDNAGWTPLHEACNHGHLELVSLLLGCGAGVNTRGMDGDTPLHDATINKHTEVVKLLLEHGSDPNLANEKEQTSLDVCPNQEIRQVLTNTTAKPKPRPQTDSENQNTAQLPVPSLIGRQCVHLSESEPKEKQEPTEEEKEGEKDEEDSAFLPEPLSTPIHSRHSRATAIQSPMSASTAENAMQCLPESTPSRTRRRGKRERGFVQRFSDVSSSESDSEQLVTARKVPRLMDRLPASVKEESSTEEKQVSGAAGEVKGGQRQVGGEGEGETRKDEKECMGGDITVAEETKEEATLDDDYTAVVREGVEGEVELEEGDMEMGGREEDKPLEVVEAEEQDATKEENEDNLGIRKETAAGEELTTAAETAREGEDPLRVSPTITEPPHSLTYDQPEKQDVLPEQHDIRRDAEKPQSPTELAVRERPREGVEGEKGRGEGEPENDKNDGVEKTSGKEIDQSEPPMSSDLVAVEGGSVAESGSGRGGEEWEEGGTGEGVEEKGGVCREESVEGKGGVCREESVEGKEGVCKKESAEGKGGVCKEESAGEPTKLILSIPFYHFKLRRGRNSPMRFVRTSSKERVPHETSMLVQHGKVESVSSILRDSQKAESIVLVKTVEKVDTTLSLESRAGSRVMSEKYAKHSRKPLLAAKKTSVKEGRGSENGGGGEGVGEGEGRGWSGGVGFGMSLGWEATPPIAGSGTSVGKGVSSTLGVRDSKPTMLSGGREGGIVPGRVGDEPGSRASPVHTRSRDSDEDEDAEDQSDDSDSSHGTVVSLSTSLPIVFSGLQQQTPKPSPLASTNAGAGSTTSSGVGTNITCSSASAATAASRDVLTVQQQPIPKTMPIVSTTLGERIMSTMKRAAQAPGKDTTAEMDESIPLSPKFRCRPVLRSAVVQQRREGAGQTPAMSHLPSFLMSTQPLYSFRQPHHPTSPKMVYPPIHSGMYKLFSEQEAERVQLRSAHLTQQDRLLLCMEQELVRAHQRASHQCSSISVCAVLLERLLPRAEACGDDRPLLEQDGDDQDGGQSVDERLLSSLVQDVWDKFCNQRTLLLTRQRNEAEAMWMLQHQQWTDRLKDLGFTHQMNFPTIHVPKLFCS